MRRRVGLPLVLAVGWVLIQPGPGTAHGQNTPKKLNPYTGNPEAIQEGRTLFIQLGCSACHGVMGGGGMGRPLTGEDWKFGSSDETLFKVIKGDIPESTMPKVWSGLESDQVWKIIAYIRSLYRGDPSKIDW